MDVAVTVMVVLASSLATVRSPFALIVVPLESGAAPSAFHVTPELNTPVPVTVAVKFTDWPLDTVGVVGLIATAVTVGVSEVSTTMFAKGEMEYRSSVWSQ